MSQDIEHKDSFEIPDLNRRGLIHVFKAEINNGQYL